MKIDAYVIALDETRYVDECDRPFIRQARGVYLFDRNQHTYCCEMTPSYYLIHLYDEILLTEEGEALDDPDRLYETYECCNGDDRYAHCRDIDAIIERDEPFTVYHYGDTDADADADAEYDEQLDALRENFCCNHAL